MNLSAKDAVKWIWQVSDGYRLRISAIAATGMLRVGLSIAFIWISKRLIDIATHRAAGEMIDWVVIMCLCIVAQLCLTPISNRLYASTDVSIYARLRSMAFQHAMQMFYTGKDKLHSGDATNRIEEDTRAVASMLTSSMPSIVVTMTRMLAAAVFLFYLDWRLGLVLILIMPLAFVLSKLHFRRMRSLTTEIRDIDSRVQSHIQENVQNRGLISSFDQTALSVDAMDNLQIGWKELVLKRNHYAVISNLMVQLGFSAGYLTAFLWGVYGLTTGAVTFGMLTAFLQLVAMVQRPVVDLGKQIPALVNTMVSAERLNEMAVQQGESSEKPVVLDSPIGIKIENLAYRYPDSDRRTIDNLTCEFPPLSMTAIYGPTGIGKTTLVKLLLGLIAPTEGSINLYNAKMTAEVSAATRGNFVVVPQGNSLISGSIRDNLLIGNPNASEGEMQEALRLACAEFVLDLPLGIDTEIGERGAGLSEGQAQRIAIARALLRKGDVLILDEPTSALDPNTELELLERMNEVTRYKTVIIVTHREITSSYCDRRISIK